jgi:nucleotide-binding universal stress UspA family protein
MYKTILVHMTGTETDEAALATAVLVARPNAAHLNCMKVRMDSGAMIAMASGVEMAPALAVAETFGLLKDRDVKLAEQARQTFDSTRRKEDLQLTDAPGAGGVSASCFELSGRDLEETISVGRLNDLVVVSRRSQSETGFSPYDLGTLIFGAGRPVLLAPEVSPSQLGRKVAIAWKDTPEAARAITAAMPLIEHAQHIILMCIVEEASQATEIIERAEEMAECLRWHTRCVEVQYPIPGGLTVPDTILEAAGNAGADLLISGAYGHSRLRETVFGGFTQRVLEGAALPVLLFH